MGRPPVTRTPADRAHLAGVAAKPRQVPRGVFGLDVSFGGQQGVSPWLCVAAPDQDEPGGEGSRRVQAELPAPGRRSGALVGDAGIWIRRRAGHAGVLSRRGFLTATVLSRQSVAVNSIC